MVFKVATSNEKYKLYEGFSDKYIQKNMKNENIPGVAIIIIQDGQIVFSKGYGYSDVNSKNIIDTKTSVFRVASIAKLVTATAIMKLVEEGKINLDDPINLHLKTLKVENNKYDEPIRIKHLLTHTEGLSQKNIGGKTLDSQKVEKLNLFLKKNMPKQFIKPGEMITYGNHASAILGLIIEDVTGEDYNTYITNHIFKPLEMNYSTFMQPISEDLMKKRVSEYRYRNDEFKVLPNSYSHMVSSGGMHTTAEDLANFLLIFQKENVVLENETIHQMLSIQYRDHPNLSGVTYGFLEQRYKSNNYLYRSGDSEGAKAKVFLLLKQNIGIVLLSNSDSEFLRDNFMEEFLDTFYPEKSKYKYENRILEDTKIYEGIYDSAQYPRNDFTKILKLFLAIKIISNEDKTITVQAINEDPFGKLEEKQVFYQIEPLLFKSADKEQYIGFKKNDKGEIIYLYSGSGYHGTYKKIDKWYQNPTLHKMAYIGFITLYFLHILYLIVKKIQKKKLNSKLNFGIISFLNILFLSFYFPGIMLIGMSPGLPAFTKGINIFMIILFLIPVFSLILLVYTVVLLYVKNKSVELKNQCFILILNILFYIEIIYWRAIFW